MNTTEQNNKLLAEFLGLETFSRGSEGFQPNSFSFHFSWDSLMKIVDKIESLGFEFQITSKHVTVLTNHSAIYQTFVYSVDGTDKITATYQTAVEFVKWYNNKLTSQN